MHIQINWVSGISLNQQILKLNNYYECWKFIFIFSYLFPSTWILKFSQVNQGLLFPSYLDMTQVYWYLNTWHSSLTMEAVNMNSSNIKNFKTFNVRKCLHTKLAATKCITESFLNREIRQRPTKQTLVFNCYKSWLYKEMSYTKSPTQPKKSSSCLPIWKN